jgi:hypothetical protein
VVLAEKALAAVEEALASDDHAAAARLVKVAEAAATKAKKASLLATAGARGKEVEEAAKQLEASKKAAEVLTKDPNDAAANLAQGKYLCLWKNDWEKGLPLLAKAGDAKWKAQAEKELGTPKDAGEQAGLAEGWWELGESETGRAQRLLRLHACRWFEEALPKLTGISKTKAEAKLKLKPK